MITGTLDKSTSAAAPETQPLSAQPLASQYRCRFCNAALTHVFVDLGTTPLCESYLSADQLDAPEPCYPLTVYLCEKCLLAQLPAHASGEQIFSEYAYFSSYSTSYLEHARQNAHALIQRFQLNPHSFVVELASNDGYLLRNFVERGVPCLGVEPATNVARAAAAVGVPTLNKFFGKKTAHDVITQYKKADLIIANNVLAHVPDLHDFICGIKTLLAPNGAAAIEVQHLLRLIEGNQFDTIYHEHFCYFTLTALISIFNSHQLTVFDVDEIATHGGSLRIYVRHSQQEIKPSDEQNAAGNRRVRQIVDAERAAHLHELSGYCGFAKKVAAVKQNLLEFLHDAQRTGHTVVGYGAPGKGNTLLNYCGVGRDLLGYTVDRNPYKHGKFLPGSRIPIHPPERIGQTRPDYVLILPWNLREEISTQLNYIREWDGKLVVPIPRLDVW